MPPLTRLLLEGLVVFYKISSLRDFGTSPSSQSGYRPVNLDPQNYSLQISSSRS